jgi:Subtilase family
MAAALRPLRKATWLSAVLLLSLAPAAGASTLDEKVALRAMLAPRTASSGIVPLPLPPSGGPSGPAASSQAAAVARLDGPARVLVGARSHADVPSLAAALRRLGARVSPVRSIAVLAARSDDPAALVARLRSDPRVAYVERDPRMQLAQDGDFPDPGHAGIFFSWAFGAVRAESALAAVGGGSRRQIAIIDTGLDVNHPDLAGRVARAFNTLSSNQGDVTDLVGHGTFVTGLIAMVDGNGLGGKGVAGTTTVFPIRASLDGSFTLSDVLSGLEFAITRGADVINLSLAGDTFSLTQARALNVVFFNDLLPVAASGNRALEGNPIEFPAALLGGRRGAPGIGLSVGATGPNDLPADFSNHNEFVSLAAPGSSHLDCRRGVFSTVPANTNVIWDDPAGGCATPLSFASGGARWGYGQGTSFAAPLASGIAALAWQVEPDLQSEQVAEVLSRSARQTIPGAPWNEFTGRGIVDGGGAVGLAAIYDTDAPKGRAKARRRGRRKVSIRLFKSADRTDPGHELAGGVTYTAAVSTDGGRTIRTLRRRSKPFRMTARLRGNRRHLFLSATCDGNGNCSVKRLGRFKP